MYQKFSTQLFAGLFCLKTSKVTLKIQNILDLNASALPSVLETLWGVRLRYSVFSYVTPREEENTLEEFKYIWTLILLRHNVMCQFFHFVPYDCPQQQSFQASKSYFPIPTNTFIKHKEHAMMSILF